MSPLQHSALLPLIRSLAQVRTHSCFYENLPLMSRKRPIISTRLGGCGNAGAFGVLCPHFLLFRPAIRYCQPLVSVCFENDDTNPFRGLLHTTSEAGERKREGKRVRGLQRVRKQLLE